jgi:hypothetical protein
MNSGLELFLVFMAGIFSVITGPNVKTVLVNVNAPETRGSIFAVYNLIDDLGKGLGPYFGALMMVSLGGLKAFNICFSFWFICGIVLLPLYWCLMYVTSFSHSLSLSASTPP